jgi:hypothetical protein
MGAEAWYGTSWSIQTTPVPSGALSSFLSGVACTSAGACTAVGGQLWRPGHPGRGMGRHLVVHPDHSRPLGWATPRTQRRGLHHCQRLYGRGRLLHDHGRLPDVGGGRTIAVSIGPAGASEPGPRWPPACATDALKRLPTKNACSERVSCITSSVISAVDVSHHRRRSLHEDAFDREPRADQASIRKGAVREDVAVHLHAGFGRHCVGDRE